MAAAHSTNSVELRVVPVDYVPDYALTAPGGWCAPLSPTYDFGLRDIWEYPDHPVWPQWDPIIAPRLTKSIALYTEARRRLRLAWIALTTPPSEQDDDWDD